MTDDQHALSAEKKTELVTSLFHMQDMMLGNPFEREIYLHTVYLAGTPYVEDIQQRILDLEELPEEERILQLLREPDNEYDYDAILVLDQDSRKLGYIPKRENTVLANLMDAGKELYAKVISIEDPPDYLGEEYPRRIRIHIFMKE